MNNARKNKKQCPKSVKDPKHKKHNRMNNIDTYTTLTADHPIILCQTRRNVHQMDKDNIPLYLNNQIDNGRLILKDQKVFVICDRKINKIACKKLISIEFLIKYVSKKERETVLTRATIKTYENAGLFTYCPNPKCNGANGFQLETNEQTGIICPFKDCGKTWCTKCKISPYHDQYTCEQAKRIQRESGSHDADIKYLLNNTQLCPKCERVVEKKEGCDHMHCVCGIYFCFVCGILLDNTYSKHVVYDNKVDTYVCPKRLEEMKIGLANTKIINYDDHNYISDEDDEEHIRYYSSDDY
jgi:hypothetical protein